MFDGSTVPITLSVPGPYFLGSGGAIAKGVFGTLADLGLHDLMNTKEIVTRAAAIDYPYSGGDIVNFNFSSKE